MRKIIIKILKRIIRLIEPNPKIIIGNNVRIGNYACITAVDEIVIENGCLFSEYIYISDHYHGFDPALNISPAKQPLSSKGKVYS